MTTASIETEFDSPTSLRANPSDRGRDDSAAGRWAGLVWTLVRTDFKVRYHGSLGGFVWALAKPLAMFTLLMGVFSFIFGSDPDYRLNLIVGLFLWDFFAEGTKAGLVSLQTRGFLLTKARCPSWILVVTSISNAAITLAVFSVIIVLFLLVWGRAPSVEAIAIYALYCLLLASIVVGFSLGASVLFLRYRDLNQVWEVVAQAGFFVAPIIYPIRILPERLHFYLYVWPPTTIIEFSRDVLIRGVVPSFKGHLLLLMVAVVSMTFGVWLFRRYEPRAAEYL